LELVWLIAVIVVLWFICDYLRDLRETLGFSFVADLIEYSYVIFSRWIAADYAEEYSKLYYYAEKRQVVVSCWGLSAIIKRDLRERHIGVLSLVIEYSCVLFSRRSRRLPRLRRGKILWIWCEWIWLKQNAARIAADKDSGNTVWRFKGVFCIYIVAE